MPQQIQVCQYRLDVSSSNTVKKNSLVIRSMMYMFRVLGSRCLTGSALLDCHVLKGFGI